MQHKFDLNEQLDCYQAQARDQAGKKLSDYAGYAAAMGAGLALAGGAEAGILYSGVQNISVQINPARQQTLATANDANVAMQGIDMNGGGVDFFAEALMVGQLAGSGNAAKYLGVGLLGPNGGAALLNAGGAGSNLAAGALIGPGGAFGTGNVGHLRVQSVRTNGNPIGSVSLGGFANGVPGFVGIRLGSGDYGWIRLQVDDLGLNQPLSTLLGAPIGSGIGYSDRVTVIDWAYDNSGAAIRAGQTSNPVPEPSSLALLAAGAAGLAAFRRRKPRLAA